MNELDKVISDKLKSYKNNTETLKQSIRNTIYQTEECLDKAGDNMNETMVTLLETVTETLSKQLEGYVANGRIDDELMYSDDGIWVDTHDKSHSIQIYFNFDALPFPQLKATAFPLSYRGNDFFEQDGTAEEIKVIG